MEHVITYHRARTNEELKQILALQKCNLPQSLTSEELESDGFVTVHHQFEILQAMNEVCPHIIAKQGENVIGYALCMHPSFADDIDVLKPMFSEISTVYDREDFIVMGQICIAKEFRKKGIFRGLYSAMSDAITPAFKCIITEVDALNLRSLHAHYAVGFKDLKRYKSAHQDWVLIKLAV